VEKGPIRSECRFLFEVVHGVGRGQAVLDRVEIVDGEKAVLG